MQYISSGAYISSSTRVTCNGNSVLGWLYGGVQLKVTLPGNYSHFRVEVGLWLVDRTWYWNSAYIATYVNYVSGDGSLYNAAGTSSVGYDYCNNNLYIYDSDYGDTWKTYTVEKHVPCNVNQVEVRLVPTHSTLAYTVQYINIYYQDRCTDIGCECCNYAPNQDICTKCFEVSWYLNSSDCYPCDYTCRSCWADEPYHCLSCYDNAFYFPTEQSCSEISSCPSTRYYQYSNPNRCQRCTDPKCISCAPENICYACDLGAYLTGTTCSPCHSSCLTCDGPTSTQCTRCYAPYYLLLGSCVEDCGEYYRKGDNHECQRCAETECMKCDNNVNECLKCEERYYLTASHTCESCTDNCITCPGGTCTKCDSPNGWFLDTQTHLCVSTCSIGYRKNTVTGMCEPCADPNCLACDDDKHICTECEPQRFFLDPESKCTPCIENCLLCTTNTSCDACDTGYQYLVSDNLCQGNCPKGYRENEGVCEACLVANCESCPDDPAICTYCLQDFYMDDSGACQASCSVGWRADVPTRTCQKCDDINCLQCTNSVSECEVCPSKMFVNELYICENCIANCAECNKDDGCTLCDPGYFMRDDGFCVETCLDYYREDVDTRSCQKCTDPYCLECPANVDTCTQCDSTPGKFLSPGDRCENCIDNCLVCSDGVSCDECNEGYYYLATTQVCTSECPIRYMKNITTKTCDICQDPNCLKCPFGSSLCSHCDVNHFVNASGQCEHCRSNCLTCDATGFCLLCETGYFINVDGLCVQCGSNCTTCDAGGCLGCIEGLFLNPDTQECEPCPSTCEVCDSSGVCTHCRHGYYLLLNNKTCITSCPLENYWRNDLEGYCEQCADPYCSKCIENPAKCTRCIDGYYSTTTGQCDECHPACYNCSSDTNCLFCKEGFYLYEENCIPSCPSSTITDDEKRACITPQEEAECIECEIKAIEVAETTSDVITKSFTASVGGIAVPVAGFQGVSPNLWDAFSIGQIIGVYDYIKIDYPSNMKTFLKGMKITHFDFVPNPLENKESSQKRLLAESADANLKDIFSKSGFKLIIVLLAAYLLYFLVRILAGSSKTLIWIKNNLEWNGILRLSTITFLPLVFYSILEMKNAFQGNEEGGLSLFLAIVGFVYALIVMSWVYTILRGAPKVLQTKETLDKYGTLYESYDIEKSAFAKYYTLIYLVKCLIIAVIICFLTDVPGLQMALIIMIDLIMLIKTLSSNVYIKRSDKVVSTLQSICLIVIEIILVIFVIESTSKKTKNTLGWIVIGLVGVVFLINIIKLIWATISFCRMRRQVQEQTKRRVDRLKIKPIFADLSLREVEMKSKSRRDFV